MIWIIAIVIMFAFAFAAAQVEGKDLFAELAKEKAEKKRKQEEENILIKKREEKEKIELILTRDRIAQIIDDRSKFNAIISAYNQIVVEHKAVILDLHITKNEKEENVIQIANRSPIYLCSKDINIPQNKPWISDKMFPILIEEIESMCKSFDMELDLDKQSMEKSYYGNINISIIDKPTVLDEDIKNIDELFDKMKNIQIITQWLFDNELIAKYSKEELEE